MKNNKNILLVLDKSGSMEKRRDTTISDYNEYISGLAEVEVNVSLFTFSSKVEKMEDARQPLSRGTYKPAGNTALFDAVARAIYSIPEGETSLVVILSDGEENMSRYQKGEGLKTLIADKKLAGWEFIFMGCEENCIKDATTLNIPFYNNNVGSSWSRTPDWIPGKFVVGHEVYCATQNYLSGTPVEPAKQ
jgi:hypothetical protein